jgi:hypothetical protein
LIDEAFDAVPEFLGVNEHDGTLFFAREPFERLLELLARWCEIRRDAGGEDDTIDTLRSRSVELRLAAQRVGYRVERLREQLTRSVDADA